MQLLPPRQSVGGMEAPARVQKVGGQRAGLGHRLSAPVHAVSVSGAAASLRAASRFLITVVLAAEVAAGLVALCRQGTACSYRWWRRQSGPAHCSRVLDRWWACKLGTCKCKLRCLLPSRPSKHTTAPQNTPQPHPSGADCRRWQPLAARHRGETDGGGGKGKGGGGGVQCEVQLLAAPAQDGAVVARRVSCRGEGAAEGRAGGGQVAGQGSR
jgi:hypothetical protein